MRSLLIGPLFCLALVSCKTTDSSSPIPEKNDDIILSDDTDPEALELLEQAGIGLGEITDGLSDGTRVRVRVNHRGDGSDVEVETIPKDDDDLSWESDEELMRAIEATLNMANGELGSELELDDMIDVDSAPLANVDQEILSGSVDRDVKRNTHNRTSSAQSRPAPTDTQSTTTPSTTDTTEDSLTTGRNAHVRTSEAEGNLFGRSRVLSGSD